MRNNFYNTRLLHNIAILVLLLLIAVGIFFRFNWTNWSQGTNLHPDEYGLTNTLVQIHWPSSIGEYFNTRIAPLSPYQKYDFYGKPAEPGADNRLRWGQWPIIILRVMGELTGNTGYNEIRLMGRVLSATADTLSLLLLFLISRRLLGEMVGLLATALSALSVMQIQQSHFMTVDNFSVAFCMMALYSCIRIAQQPLAIRAGPNQEYRFCFQSVLWFVVFGVFYGMTVASRINLLPLAGMVGVAALISVADLTLRRPNELQKIALIVVLQLFLAGFVAIMVFRVTQPMSFRAPQGDTNFLTFALNPDWVESMRVAQNESNGIGGGPPSEQWANRPAIIFPWINIVVWGMGLPLGLTAWTGLLWATYRLLRYADNWRVLLLPIIWTGGYFLFMGTRFVKSVRYFLPIYPFLCLFAAYLLYTIWRHTYNYSRPYLRILFQVTVLSVVLGTLVWSTAFVNAVYQKDHTRIQATKWILQNVPSPLQIVLKTVNGYVNIPIPLREDILITNAQAVIQPFRLPDDGRLIQISVSRPLLNPGENSGIVHVEIRRNPADQQVIDQADIEINSQDTYVLGSAKGQFKGTSLEGGTIYYLMLSSPNNAGIRLKQAVLANENWDEGLPLPLEGYYPFGELYRGITMEVRWYDDENKREMFLHNLAQVDYIILPSQRAIWSVCRIPLTYPMTLEYYRALFDGRLGFDLVAQFDSPLEIGYLKISDVGGQIGWKVKPKLPLFNYNFLAAEEAFSVYDHPPVWIFKKRSDFNIDNARRILSAIDLSKVIVQSPREATPLYK